MERNPTNDPIGTGGSTGTGMGGSASGASGGAGASTLGTGTDSLGVTGQGADQNATNGGLGASSGGGEWGASQVGGQGGASAGSAGIADRLNQAKGMASERLGQAREKAGELKSTLADKLEAGASSLRSQGGPQLAGMSADGSATAASDPMARLSGPAADAMQKTAEFLRDGDLKATLENQVRTNPARTLLIAVGVGYLLGKALRSDR
jgi:hypothetical protein